MLKRTLLFLLIFEFAFGFMPNPCEDERYLQIKEKSLDDMSDREYSYFTQKDKECSEYTMSGMSKKIIEEPKPEAEPLNKNQQLNLLLDLDPDAELNEDIFNIFVKKLDSLGVETDQFEDGYEWSGGYYGFKAYIDDNIDELLNTFSGKEETAAVDAEDDGAGRQSRKDKDVSEPEKERPIGRKGKKFGFRIGCALIRPVMSGSAFSEHTPYFDLGISIRTPIGINLGPIFASIGMEMNGYSFSHPSEDSLSHFGKYFAGIIDLDISDIIRFGGKNIKNHILGGLASYDDGIGLGGGANQLIRFGAFPISFSIIERFNLIKMDSGAVTYWVSLGANIGYHF